MILSSIGPREICAVLRRIKHVTLLIESLLPTLPGLAL